MNSVDNLRLTQETGKLGRRLAELCRRGEHATAVRELYANECLCYEVAGSPDGAVPRVNRGKQTLLEQVEWWLRAHEVHSCSVSDPYPNGDEFIVTMHNDVTANEGPYAGKRFEMKEACRYKVEDGKIVEATFYYEVPEA